MRNESLEFFKNIVNVPSPSGYEQRAAEVYRQYAQSFADQVHTDLMGNVIAAVNPEAKRNIMLAGHIDEIGFIIRFVSDEGLLYFGGIGGHDSTIAIGQRVWVHTESGQIPGIIGRKAIHLLDEEERKKKPSLDELWIDIGARSKAEVEEAGVQLGDCVTYQYDFQQLRGDYYTARGFDNKMGAFIVGEALRLYAENKGEAGVHAVATVQEEIGLRGARTAAFGVNSEIGIAVDVGHASDYPTVDKKKVGDLKMGSGPAICRGANNNPTVVKMLVETAKEEGIPYQIEVAPGGTGTDANAMQINQAGMATCLISVPIRYMHTPCELLNLQDVENCARLIAAFCKRVTSETNFTPGL